jgi:8-oxo-dGTP pyrophosphatase MutT (NUDIX family)
MLVESSRTSGKKLTFASMGKRIYHHEGCLELRVLGRREGALPSTKVLPFERPREMLYVPGTLPQVRELHLAQPYVRQNHILYFPTEEALNNFFEAYRKTFHNLVAAGGAVRDERGNILFIWKRQKWDLPKGKVEPHETPEESAQREIREETGLSELRLVRYLMETYHIYQERGDWIFKTAHWFLFETAGVQPPVQVQAEEGIERYLWAKPSEVPFLYPQSYGTIREVIEKVLTDVLPAASG